MARERIPANVQTFIVQQLAMFDAPSVIVASVNKEFGHALSRQAVERYDPTKASGAGLAGKWRALFDETRKTFLEDTGGIAISHRAVRLRALQRMAEKAEDRGNMVLAASLLEQAAKEMGEAYTNRRLHELTGANGGPISHAVSPREMSDDELARIALGGGNGASATKEGA